MKDREQRHPSATQGKFIINHKSNIWPFIVLFKRRIHVHILKKTHFLETIIKRWQKYREDLFEQWFERIKCQGRSHMYQGSTPEGNCTIYRGKDFNWCRTICPWSNVAVDGAVVKISWRKPSIWSLWATWHLFFVTNQIKQERLIVTWISLEFILETSV